ncbi:MAG TPA: M20/M25/M40 family metallo-hydrolase [Bacillota bacterium]|jgi:acetylornithine deacetylase/succinyl-diaminopimelate desuccinylase-like protein|nr:M20/M25/M40 family metallo-hydrolase [Bacillota bacterium]
MMNIGWEKVRSEVTQLLVDLIRINTTNPPGNEYEAALYLQEFCNRQGIEATIYASASKRGNLVATVRGNGTGRPLILLSHLDVVAANAAQWTHQPFAGEISDGYVWGRGALDMKGMLAMELMALVLYKQSGLTPNRDLILVAAADEEAGGDFGMDWLMKQQIPGIEAAEYVINEGGEGMIRNGIPVYTCQNGEKGVLWVKLTVQGTPGHASMPTKDNAITRLANILTRLGRHKQPMVLTETTRQYLFKLAKTRGLRLPEESGSLDFSLQMFAKRHFKGERSVEAMFYNTVTPTIIKAGEKTNVLPECCEVTLDCRLLPGETPEQFLEKLQNYINTPDVKFEIIHAAAPTESPVNTELFRIMEETVREEDPRAVLVPYLSPGGTDSRYFRQKGVTAYGFVPILITEEDLQRMHGIDERISIDNLERGTKILYNVIKKLSNS